MPGRGKHRFPGRACCGLEDLRNQASHEEKPPTPGWDYLMKYNDYSTRAYMNIAYKPNNKELRACIGDGPLPTAVINWLETVDKSTGWYDRSLAETVLEAMAFGAPESSSKIPWWYIV